MVMKLVKTFLSKRPTSLSFMMGVISLVLMTLFFGANPESFSANGFLVYERGEYWRAFTSTLLHADLNHLAHNAFFLLGLSTLLHNYFGFWVFPVLSLIAGGIINLIALKIYPPAVHLVGVSGVIYFMASFWLTSYMLIERRHKILSRFIYATGITLIFLFPQVFQPEVSYLAHGLGFIVGIPFAILYFAFNFKRIRSAEEWVETKKDPIELYDIELEQSDYRFQNEGQGENNSNLH
jgi:rhomboid protease GluP